tara:strand:+ start:216 stop:908 length:693 start_codon:yes stop_codon:yes gene_type:complete
MVPVDRVYQKVLALLNKEQRGYLTPQEFNLLADKAQKEIFESYFAQPSEKLHKDSNDDSLDMLAEKLQHHRTTTSASGSSSNMSIGALYKIDFVKYRNTDGIDRVAKEVSESDFHTAKLNPLTSPTKTNRYYCRNTASQITIFPTGDFADTSFFIAEGWALPNSPNWAYVVVNDKALYNPNSATDFDLHESEEEHLVNRILELSGVIVQKPGLIELAKSDRMLLKQEQNS